MKGVIETLKFTDSNGEKYNLYPRTLIECISNQNGDSLEDTLQQYVDTQFSDTYADKTYVAEQIADSNHLIREIVTEIPTAETAKDNVIYMYKVDSASGNDVYQEYQLIGGEVVLVGDTSVDLSNYVQSETLDNYLKTTGGKIDGNVLIGSDEAIRRDLELYNGVRDINNRLDADGLYRMVDKTNNKDIIYSSADGTNTFNGTATNAEKLGGKAASEYALGTDLANKLDKTGGIVGDTFQIQPMDANGKYVTFQVSTENGLKVRYKDGSTGDVLSSVNVGSYALPIGGGTVGRLFVEDTSNVPFIVHNTNGNDKAMVNFYGIESLGYLGFNEVNTPRFVKNDGVTEYDLLHTGNKPSGTYTGTGSSTREPITIGGISTGVLHITGGGYSAIVTQYGATVHGGGGTSPQSLTASEIKYQSGKLTIATTSAFVNGSGTAYAYYVL